MAAVRKTGWLEKQGQGNKSWKRRFFELRPDKMAIEYRKEPSDSVAAGSIPLTQAQVRIKTDHKIMDIQCPERTYHIKGRLEDLRSWGAAILKLQQGSSAPQSQVDASRAGRQQQRHEQQRQDKLQQTQQQRLSAEQQQQQQQQQQQGGGGGVIKTGWMDKQGSKMQGWKRRFFVMTADRISYFKNAGDAPRSPKGQILLKNAKCSVMKGEDPSEVYMEIETKSTDNRIFLLRASMACIQEWLPVVRAQISRISNPAPARGAAVQQPRQQQQSGTNHNQRQPRQQQQSGTNHNPQQQDRYPQQGHQQEQHQQGGHSQGQGPHGVPIKRGPIVLPPDQEPKARYVDDDPGVDQQIQTQMFAERTLEDVIAEREAGVQELEKDMTMINEMFHQMHSLVHEQGDKLGSIDNAMTSTEVTVGVGVNNIQRADKNLGMRRLFGSPATDQRNKNGTSDQWQDRARPARSYEG